MVQKTFAIHMGLPNVGHLTGATTRVNLKLLLKAYDNIHCEVVITMRIANARVEPFDRKGN